MTKKKIVFFLCYLRMEKLAYKISPSYVDYWIGKQFAKGFKKGIGNLPSKNNSRMVVIDLNEALNKAIKEMRSETNAE